MMRSKSLVLSFLVVLTGCSGWNSEIQSRELSKSTLSEKPRCQFKVTNNCWQRSIALLSDCFSDSQQVLFSDGRVASGNGRLVTFSEPINGLENLKNNKVEFRIYVDQKKCFRFKGSRDNFTIDESAYGSLRVSTLDNGDRLVSCFSNESFVIPKEAQQSGCQGEKSKVSQFNPQAIFKSDSKSKIYRLILTGVTKEVDPIFSCVSI